MIASQQALGAGQYGSLMPLDIQLDEADRPQAWCQIQGVQPLARDLNAPPGHRANRVGSFNGGKSRGLVGDVQFHLARFVGKGNGMDASPPPEARLQKSGLLRVGFKNVQFKNTPGERRGEKSPRAADIQPKAAGLDQPSRQFDAKAGFRIPLNRESPRQVGTEPKYHPLQRKGKSAHHKVPWRMRQMKPNQDVQQPLLSRKFSKTLLQNKS